MKSFAFGERLSFRPNGRGRLFLAGGWSAPEALHCWTDGMLATLDLHPERDAAGDVCLHMRCAGFSPARDAGPQDVSISLSGERLAQWSVGAMGWHSAVIPRSLMNKVPCRLEISTPGADSPARHGLSPDSRMLGVDLESLVMFVTPDLDNPDQRITAGHDPVGDMYYIDGCYHRAIRHERAEFFDSLWRQGVYDELAEQGLIPKHFVRKIDHPAYAYLASSVSGNFVYPAKYPWIMLLDAARTWVEINEWLLNLPSSNELGLCDGHYGNFIQCKSGAPKWCDVGSLMDTESALQFGYEEFVRCYMLPLWLSTKADFKEINLRQLMALNPRGADVDTILPGRARPLELGFPITYAKGERREAISALKKALHEFVVPERQGYWSNYRSVHALDAAWKGELERPGHDSRFTAVMDQVRRSGATTFLDIGSNDGIFSLLCVRAGLKGIAMDIDEDSLNKLYTFIRDQRDASLGISYAGFLDVEFKADLVLALALTHHLTLSQNLSFDRIAAKLAETSKECVITEFMPDGLGGTPQNPKPHPDPLPSYYSLDNFLQALRLHFTHVEAIDYERKSDPAHFSRRVLVFCSKGGEPGRSMP